MNHTMNMQGLSAQEVAEATEKFGKNLLPEKKPPTDFQIILSQLKSPLVYVLLVAGVVTFFLGDYEDTVIIMVSVVLNTILGRYQESKAGKALQALKDMLQPTIQVMRGGALTPIQTKDIVPGDIVLCRAGAKIPADGVVCDTTKLTVSEAMLTGESLPIEKNVDDKVFMGTVVLSGSAYFRVTTIGSSTELGKIAVSLQGAETITPLQKQLQLFSKQLTWLVVGIVIIVIIIGVLRQHHFTEVFTTAVALAVGAIPEGLLVALTVVLTIGMQRILHKRGLVKNLVSAETLGGVTVICSDKTGTLTHGTMEVVECIGNKKQLYHAVVHTNDDDNAVAKALRSWSEQSVSVYGAVPSGERLDILPFSSDHKYTASLWKDDTGTTSMYVLGAPEYLMQRSTLSTQEQEEITKHISTYTEGGYRLIACGTKILDDAVKKSSLHHEDVIAGGFSWTGIICLADPIREDVKEALQKTHQAGIKLVVITGDYPGTARAIMKQLGVTVDEQMVMTGDRLATLSDQELDTWLEQNSQVKLFARTKPEQKMRIVNALKDDGEIVAMMGDGVNDAPALKKADIGIVVGEATEVAKESADLVLLDSSFSTIVSAVEEGRGMFDNIRKIVLYLLCDAFVQIIAILLAMITGYPLPISASQILWINLVSDGLPNIALTVDPIRKGVMQMKPRSPKEPLVASWMKQLILLVSTIGAVCSFMLFIWVYHTSQDLELARSVAFASFGVGSLVYVFSVRTLGDPVWKQNPFQNGWLLVSIIGGFALLISPYIFSGLGNFLDIVPIGGYWFHAFGVAIIMFVFIELYKKLYKINAGHST